MSPLDSLHQGDLEKTLTDLQNQVRKNPADPKLRIFLFQLLSVMGQWDRALTQLNVCRDMSDANLAMGQTYQEALRAEVFRKAVFDGTRSPLIFGKPNEWVALLSESLRVRASGKADESLELRNQAFELAPAVSGSIEVAGSGQAAEKGTDDDETTETGQRFEWIADADARLGPCLEAIVNGNYYWIPFDCIRRIQFDPPEDLRDFVWMPAYFTWANEGQSAGLIPARYPGSETHGNNQVRLARYTDWVEENPDDFVGFGQRMLATDTEEFALLDVRDITLDVSVVDDG
jgi:type VI secretion system protein ImpE